MRRWLSSLMAFDSGDPDYDRRARTLTAIVLVDFLMMWNGYKSLRRDMENPQIGQGILSAPDHSGALES